MGTERTGDFDDFYRARFGQLANALYLACGDWAKAEDATQQAFVRAWQRWSKMSNDDPVGWVRTVAWRICLDEGRARRRDQRALQRLRGQTASTTGPPDLDTALRCLEPLSPPLRAVTVLHYLEDLPVAGIASVLGIPSGTVKSRLSRARDVMRLGTHEPGKSYEQEMT